MCRDVKKASGCVDWLRMSSHSERKGGLDCAMVCELTLRRVAAHARASLHTLPSYCAVITVWICGQVQCAVILARISVSVHLNQLLTCV